MRKVGLGLPRDVLKDINFQIVYARKVYRVSHDYEENDVLIAEVRKAKSKYAVDDILDCSLTCIV